MLKSDLSYLTTSPKQLGENSKSNSPWRVLLNFRCQVQPGKCSTASEQRRISICQRQKYWLTLLTYLRASKSPTADFLYYDSASHDQERLLFFATPSNLGVLEDSTRWYCDGTFCTSPDVFYQVYKIHGEVSLTNTHIIPLVHAQLPNKKQETYSRLLKALNFNPSSVTIDFQTAQRNALKQISTDVQI